MCFSKNIYIYIYIYIYGRVSFNVSLCVARPRSKVLIPLGSKVLIPLWPESPHTFTGPKSSYLYSPGLVLDPHGSSHHSFRCRPAWGAKRNCFGAVRPAEQKCVRVICSRFVSWPESPYTVKLNKLRRKSLGSENVGPGWGLAGRPGWLPQFSGWLAERRSAGQANLLANQRCPKCGFQK
jgi:hypothetical protein